MKRAILFGLLIWLGYCVNAFALGTVTQTMDDYGDIIVVNLTTADARNGSVAIDSTFMTKIRNRGMWLYGVETNPGTLTAAWDMTIVDEDGLDVCAGSLANRDATATQYVYCMTSTQPLSPARYSTLTPTITNQAETSTLTIRCVFSK